MNISREISVAHIFGTPAGNAYNVDLLATGAWANDLLRRLNLHGAYQLHKTVHKALQQNEDFIFNSRRWRGYLCGIRRANRKIISAVETFVPESSNIYDHFFWRLLKGNGKAPSLRKILSSVDRSSAEIVRSRGSYLSLPWVDAHILNRLIDQGSLDSLTCLIGLLFAYCRHTRVMEFRDKVILMIQAIYKALLIFCVRIEWRHHSQELFDRVYILFLSPAARIAHASIGKLNRPFGALVDHLFKRANVQRNVQPWPLEKVGLRLREIVDGRIGSDYRIAFHMQIDRYENFIKQQDSRCQNLRRVFQTAALNSVESCLPCSTIT